MTVGNLSQASEAFDSKFRVGYFVGVFVQTIVWTLVLLALALAWLVKVEIEPFRYMGF